MGLDQYLYRASKTNNICANESYDYDDKLLMFCEIIKKEEINHKKYEGIKNFAIPIRIRQLHYNIEQIIKDYNLDKTAYVRIINESNIVVKNASETQSVTISTEDVDKKYTIPVMSDVYVVQFECIYSWKKDYKISDFMANKYRMVSDCGFYPVDKALAAELNNLGSSIDLEEIPEENSNIFYHEWF